MFIVIFAILYFISSTFLCPDCIRINLRACKTKKIPWEEPQTPCSGALTCAPHALRARGILLPTFSSTPIWQFLDTPLLYGTVRYCTVLYCTVMYCNVSVLYCSVLYWYGSLLALGIRMAIQWLKWGCSQPITRNQTCWLGSCFRSFTNPIPSWVESDLILWSIYQQLCCSPC